MIDTAPSASAAVDARRQQPLLAFVRDDVTVEAIEQAARDLGFAATFVRGGVTDAARRLARTQSPRILVVDLTGSEMALSEIEELANVCDPGVQLLAVGERNDVGLYRDLLARGIVDYLVKPVTSALVRASLTRGSDTATRPIGKQARMVSVIGARGGVGASMVASSIGWLLAERRRRKTMIVDLDLSFGTVPLSFDLEPARGLREALEEPERADGLIIERSASRVSDRLALMAAEDNLLPLPSEPRGLQLVLEEVRRTHHFIVADLPHAMNSLTVEALGHADSVLLVTDLSVAGLRDAVRLSSTITAINGAANVQVIANLIGQHRHGEVPLRDFEAGLGRKLASRIGFDPKNVLPALNVGKPVPLGSPRVAEALQPIVDGLCGSATPAKGGLLARFLMGRS